MADDLGISPHVVSGVVGALSSAVVLLANALVAQAQRKLRGPQPEALDDANRMVTDLRISSLESSIAMRMDAIAERIEHFEADIAQRLDALNEEVKLGRDRFHGLATDVQRSLHRCELLDMRVKALEEHRGHRA